MITKEKNGSPSLHLEKSKDVIAIPDAFVPLTFQTETTDTKKVATFVESNTLPFTNGRLMGKLHSIKVIHFYCAVSSKEKVD